nr:MAG: portal protein [Bacteriophage sp.]
MREGGNMDGKTNMTTIQDVLGDIGAGEAMQPIGVAQIRTAMDTLTKYKNGKSALEKRLIACEQWWKLQHWQEMSPSGNPYDPQWRSAWLFNVIMGKHADAVAAFPEPAIRPREPDDRSEAAMLTSIVPVILEQNDFEETYSDSCWTKMKQGTLAWGVFWDSSKLNGLGDVSIREIDLLNLFWEPGVTDIQKSKNLFYAELVDNDVLKQRYPQVGDTLRSDNTFVSKYKTDDQVDTTNKSLVVDWYYKKIENGKSVLHFCKFVGETVLSATENDPNMQSGLYEDGDYPFVIDALFPVKGSIAGYGYIDIGKSAQEQIDLLNQAILKNSVMASTPRWFIRSDGSINEKEYADWRKPFVHAAGNLGQDSVMPITVSPLSANYINVIQNKIEELKWTTGNTDVNNGSVSSGVTAASAIAALQEASGRSSKDATRSAYRAYARLIRMVIERIRQFYDLPRKFRIRGQLGTEEYVTYSNQNLKQQELLGLGGDVSWRKPVFDIEVSAQKSSEYTRLSQNELALQFYQLGFFDPTRADQALATLDMMDFDGKDEISQKIAQNGTLQQELASWQQMALALAERFDPAMADGLAQQILGADAQAQAPAAGSAKAEMPGEGAGTEAKTVKDAREQSQKSTQPD